MEADALVVGGGPVGLALALGLLQRGLKVKVLEKTRAVGNDWSNVYTYRIDSRGIACLERLGLHRELAARGVESRGFSGINWAPDGSLSERTSQTSIGLGYWIQRPNFLALLEASLPSGILLHGTLEGLEVAEANATITATAELEGNRAVRIRARLVFGCDGTHSAVRRWLQGLDSSLEAGFEPRVLRTPSSGLVYKAVLYNPPEAFEPGKMHVAMGRSGLSLGMLPFAGRPGEPRPLSFAQLPGHPLHSFATPDDVYRRLREEFPQLEVDSRLPAESAEAWCATSGSTFPGARWCARAAHAVGGVGVAILGDALHSFPPDLGQGVNAGLADVSVMLDMWPDDQSQWAGSLRAYEASQVPEAVAICKLLPIGMPYQYNLQRSIAKYAFFAGLLVRVLANKLCPTVFSPIVVFDVTSDPPLRYTEILRRHEANTRRLFWLGASVFGASAAAMSWLAARRSRRAVCA